jgi:hypothetical protein
MRVLSLLVLVALVGCGAGSVSDSGAFTLYRSSPLDPNMRIHVASFDASDGEAYNRENCELAERLFKSQTGVTVRYFCEKGRYRE